MKTGYVRIGNHLVGDGQRVFVIAELGINHNGSLEIAKRMIDGAVLAGCDAVKFQKRTPEACVPKDQWNIERDTPWGRMTYLEYRHKIEFTADDYAAIDRYCRERNVLWFASCWDEESVDFMEQFEPPCYKAASVEVTGFHKLVGNIRDIEKSMGDGIKRVHESELPSRKKLRRVASVVQ